MKLLIIVPAYNEAGNLDSVISDLRLHCPSADVLVVNDCSTDDSAAVLARLGVAHLNLPVNLGIGGAVQSGYRYAQENGYDVAVQFDGDGQHDAAFLADLLAPVLSGEADVAIGSRFLEKEGFQSTVLRRFGIDFLSRLIRDLSGVDVKDVTSGMRAVNAKMISVYAREYAQDYPEPEALLLAGKCGAKVAEIPVRMRERLSGKSSINPIKSVYYMIKVTLTLLLSAVVVPEELR